MARKKASTTTEETVTTAAETVEETAAETTAETTEEAAVEPMIGSVNTAKGLNVREKPSTDSSIVTVLKDGQKVDIIGEDGAWWQIGLGYVMKEFIIIADE